MPPIHNPAPAWATPRSDFIKLYHGCTTDDKNRIKSSGVSLTAGRNDLDFGRGFYTTTIVDQARHWAWIRFYDPKFRRVTGVQPCIIWFRVNRFWLAELTWLAFVWPDRNNDDYWSLVQHCRQSTANVIHDHHGPIQDENGNRWYDVVFGPVAAFWQQRTAMDDSDQLSFHTERSALYLTGMTQTGQEGQDYGWEPIV